LPTLSVLHTANPKNTLKNKINDNKYDINKCARLKCMQQQEFSSELLVFRNATRLKSGHSATEREWGWDRM